MLSASSPPVDQGPHHLAQTVLRALSVSSVELPEEWLLGFFFDVLYQASFRIEHGRPLLGRVVWRSPAACLDSAKSGDLMLMKPVPLNVSSLAALMQGVQPQKSALLVSASESNLLVIQGTVRCGGVPRELGLFCAEIFGPAHLTVDVGMDYPLELRRNRLHLSTQKVFTRGPVRRRLASLLENLFPLVQTLLPGEIASSPLLTAASYPLPGGNILINEQDWAETLEQFWVHALIQLLRQIFTVRQSGSILLTHRRDTSSQSDDWLVPPHEAAFSHLRHLLEQRAVQAIVQQVEAVKSLSERAATLKDIPLDDLALQEPVLNIGVSGTDLEMTEAIAFLAALSQVEGILRLDPQLDLISFGGQPNPGSLPERVYLASTEMAAEADLTPISFRSFGPRNQALLAQCLQYPESIGFAFTQEGDVRAMLWHEEKLLVWNNIQIPHS